MNIPKGYYRLPSNAILKDGDLIYINFQWQNIIESVGRKVSEPSYSLCARQLRNKQKPKNRNFLIVSENDGNDSFTVSAKNYEEATREALLELGWWVAKN